jgi:hypothetical protein
MNAEPLTYPDQAVEQLRRDGATRNIDYERGIEGGWICIKPVIDITIKAVL